MAEAFSSHANDITGDYAKYILTRPKKSRQTYNTSITKRGSSRGVAKFVCAAMWAFEGDLRNYYAVTSAPKMGCVDGERLTMECSPKHVHNNWAMLI